MFIARDGARWPLYVARGSWCPPGFGDVFPELPEALTGAPKRGSSGGNGGDSLPRTRGTELHRRGPFPALPDP